MSKQNPKQGAPRQVVPLPRRQDTPLPKEPKASNGFSIPKPWLILAIVAFMMYAVSINFGLTELDDSIFIRDFHANGYNDDLMNLFRSFGRGLFDATRDSYYRPIFLDSMVLNFQVSKLEPAGYHFVNVLLHCSSVILLYFFFIRIKLPQLQAFILTLIFALHPVLSQAVAWIPGRNDTILAVFTLWFLNKSIDYANSSKPKDLMWAFVALALAFFTKETAVFVAPAAFVILVLVMGFKWNSKKLITQYATWAGAFVLWFAARTLATTHTKGMDVTQVVTDFVSRLPLILQYIGKIFLPVNLSVFPTQQDTSNVYGIIAFVLLAVLVFMAKDGNKKKVLAGFIIYLLFLVPALIVPKELNEQTFEHRLYLPIIGILLILPETIAFRSVKEKNLLYAAFGLVGVMAIANYNHQQCFTDPRTFWKSAVQTTPNSAFANMMLGARPAQGKYPNNAEFQNAYSINPFDAYVGMLQPDGQSEKEVKNSFQSFQSAYANNLSAGFNKLSSDLSQRELKKSFSLFRKAYALNPDEKYLNFYYGKMLQMQDSVLASEAHLLKEKKTSNYYECDFYLARVSMEKHDTTGAINYLLEYIKRDKQNEAANKNLLLMLVTKGDGVRAREQLKRMQENGITVPPDFAQKVNTM